MKKIIFVFFVTAIFATISCTSSKKQKDDLPSWFISPKQNDSQNLYGVAEGFTLEEATKYSLADAASRLIVTISSESSLLRQESKTDFNEEMRQQVRQSVEKINFVNFRVSKSAKTSQKFFVETEIERDSFIRDQKEQITFLEKKIANLDQNSKNQNTIQRRNSLLKILQLGKELELKSRILKGAKQEVNLTEKLQKIANFQNELEKLSDKSEFYFEANSSKEISQIILKNLNKEKLKISPRLNSSNRNQIIIKIKSTSRSSKVYEAYSTKLKIDFENLAEEKIIASNSIEISGSSIISEKESYLAALQKLDEKISQEGILKIIGITD